MSLFITFEGCEGSGKSTQAKLAYNALLKKGKKVVLTREPGGTALAEKIRRTLLAGGGIVDPLTEFLLISAARRDHVENLIKPMLNQGNIVICDRFFDSSFAYQGYAKGLDLKLIKQVIELSIGKFKPDITFIMDINPQTAMARIDNNKRIDNHYDNMNLEFHNAIRNAFLILAKKDKNRITVIDSSREIKSIHDKIMNEISNKI